MKEFDYIIIGGGCSGLSLAYELQIFDKLKQKTLAIIEPREDYKRDKTWSFWKVFSHNFDEISSTINLANTFYEKSFYSIKDIPINFRFSILVARRVYRKIGYKILNKKNLENYKNSGKIYVSNIEKIIETLLAIFDLIKLSLINKNDDNIKHDHDLIYEEINLNERI